MPSLTRTEVAEIALLARLHLEPDEVETMQRELGALLDHFTSLSAVDTTGVAPMTHAVPATAALRQDVVESSLPVDEALAATARRDGVLIVVPAILPAGAPGGSSGSGR